MAQPSAAWHRLAALLQDPLLVARRLLLLGLDGVLISVSFWGAITLRVADTAARERYLMEQFFLLPWAVGIGLLVLLGSGWYTSLLRASGSHSFYRLLPRSGVVVLLLLLVSTLHGGYEPPRSFWILLWLFVSALTIFSRILLRDLLRLRLQSLGRLKGRNNGSLGHGEPTIIYGAGEAGLSLLEALQSDWRFEVKAVVDDDPALWGRRLRWQQIHAPQDLSRLRQSEGVCQVLLAMPSLTRAKKRALVSSLSSLGLHVLEMPSLAQLASGERRLSELKPVLIEDLLGREPSVPDPVLLAQAVQGKTVLVSGAGGSIGTELCRQILRLSPAALVLLERNEYALYRIQQELTDLARQEGGACPVRSVLADVAHQPRLERLLSEARIQVFFHAAAYKHVPLLEQNVCIGVANNVLATRSALQAALACGVERFTLISTDKAVRPTNAMGASKRVCELLLQDAAAQPGVSTICSMVRFGNVLASSGSVVPRFRQQIAAGGPVTVTHPEITRYFMTIAEASALVIQATGMAQGGDVFVLDMGEPVRILDLARQMIQLSGFTVRDQTNPRGDVAIEFSGLRPGEKLYEELLISSSDAPTSHPLISKAVEHSLSHEQLQALISRLERALAEWNDGQALAVLAELVPEYEPRGRGAALPPRQQADARVKRDQP